MFLWKIEGSRGTGRFAETAAAPLAEKEQLSFRKAAEDVLPSPATHAILTVLKAGESVFQTLY